MASRNDIIVIDKGSACLKPTGASKGKREFPNFFSDLTDTFVPYIGPFKVEAEFKKTHVPETILTSLLIATKINDGKQI